ncbi:hypothetical protein GGQ84_002945 [Desulfitispora alkaliphila]|uniref:hypothetical protein n=1 Tax=Desulfitispora alkaliphila TaxID=622674 RepID=UPI003D21D126
MKKNMLLLVSLALIFSLAGCNFTYTNDNNSKKADEAANLEAKSFEEIKAELESIGFKTEMKKMAALNDITNERLEFVLSISELGEYKYIHFEFPGDAIGGNLKETIIAIDSRDIMLIDTMESEGVEMYSEGVVWKVGYEKGLDNYWLGFYIKSRNNDLDFNGELTLSHGDYHWRGNY